MTIDSHSKGLERSHSIRRVGKYDKGNSIEKISQEEIDRKKDKFPNCIVDGYVAEK